jgi:hypothetical protein
MTHPWFFATNALTLSDPDYINMTLAMLASQRINAPTLVPHMIYDGPEDDFCDTVKQAGVHVIHNEFSMLDEIKKKTPTLVRTHFSAYCERSLSPYGHPDNSRNSKF